MRSIHRNLYYLLLAQVYRHYRVPDSAVNGSGVGRYRYRTTAMGRRTAGGGGKVGRVRIGEGGPVLREGGRSER